jgi:hypothetical protein
MTEPTRKSGDLRTPRHTKGFWKEQGRGEGYTIACQHLRAALDEGGEAAARAWIDNYLADNVTSLEGRRR